MRGKKEEGVRVSEGGCMLGCVCICNKVCMIGFVCNRMYVIGCM